MEGIHSVAGEMKVMQEITGAAGEVKAIEGVSGAAGEVKAMLEEPLIGSDEGSADLAASFKRCFDVFPSLVWKNIVNIFMKELAAPETAWSLVTAAPELRNGVFESAEVLFYKVLPLIFSELNKKDILNCRAVSKSWCNIIDHFLDTHPSQNPYNVEDGVNIETGYGYCSLVNKDMDFMISCKAKVWKDIHVTNEARKEAGLKPAKLVGGSVCFYPPNLQDLSDFDASSDNEDDDDEDENEAEFGENLSPPVHSDIENVFQDDEVSKPIERYYTALSIFLEQSGSSISQVGIHLTTGKYQGAHFKGFVKCLSQLPNLKTLKVFMPFRWPGDLEYQPALIRLAQLFQQYPLPVLPNLTNLELLPGFCFTEIQKPIRDILIHLLRSYDNQIEKLGIDSQWWDSAANIQLSHLKELSLKWHFTLTNSKVIAQNRESLLRYNINASSLRKIEMTCLGYELAGILELLQRFERIETIELNLVDFCPDKPNTLPVLPTVRVLRFFYYQWEDVLPKNMLLLNSFPNLELLEIRMPKRNASSYKNEKTRKELLKCNLNMGPGMKKTSVWSLMPRLKLLIFEKNRWGREQWV